MNEKQQQALHLCLQGHNVLLTGGAGVGKSFCLKRIVEALREQDKTVAVTAMTGFASVPIDGITFHSFSKIRVRFNSTEMDKIIEEAIVLSVKDQVADDARVLDGLTIQVDDARWIVHDPGAKKLEQARCRGH